MNKLLSFVLLSSYLYAASSITIADIQGPAFQSPLVGQTVHNVTGVVTAKGSSGFFLAGEKSTDMRVSNGLMVFSTSASLLKQVSVGDEVSLSGKVSEYRSSSAYLYLTELISPSNVAVLSSNNTVTPVILGKDITPPTRKLSPLDVGSDGFLSVPNNSSLVEGVNATLVPETYGLDFWESLEGQLVTIPKAVSSSFPNSYGEFWAYGDWPVTGKNGRGGLTITFGPDGIPDGNPEAVMIGSPLDGTKNPTVAVGFGLGDITGVVTYQYGYYYVLPLTAPSVVSVPSEKVAPTTLTSKLSDLCTISFGDYNVENLAPTSSHLPAIASHIVNYLKTPDIIFLQEIQDNSGATDDGTVSANVTLTTLANGVAQLSNVTYAFTEIAPIDGQDGGQPGGNIRVAYFYRPEKLSLVSGSPIGGSLDAVEVKGIFGNPKLSLNPGRIDPTNPAWDSTRKPLAAAWQTKYGTQFFTVNVHLSSKGGSSSTQGDARPPVNSPIETRTSQVESVAAFIKSLLLKDPLAKILVGGDFNEYTQTRSVFKSLTKLLTDIDEVADIPEVERYSYVYDQHSQQLDHVLVSLGVRIRKTEFEHLHVNNWELSLSSRISDHDPSAGRIRIC
ncbi:Endonuclease/exonuclease/phosphatase [Cyathus striatus]|nr:Endonuclease/exonuclease/phosphatase [Cyathus striatus]